LKEKQLQKALDLLTEVAEIPRNIRDTTSPVVKHFVDIARSMTLKIGASLRSSQGWLPESLVEQPNEIAENQIILSPNPASTFVQMTLKSSDYRVNVLNAVGQTIFEQNTEGVLSVNVSTWTNGIYLFEITDNATHKQQRSKIMVKH
jgi:Secretion system C-terminal sorting domain